MATFEEILDEWDNDSTIDGENVDRESINVPKLHAKYLRYLTEIRRKIMKYEYDLSNLKKVKFRYYRGELTREELKECGWDQWQGAKPMKNEMDHFLEGDVDLNNIKMKIAYAKNIEDAIKSIMSQINGRDWQLKNIIAWKNFLAGN